jgi:hypothetical protein
VEELTALERASATCTGGPVRVIAVNVAEDPAAVTRYVAEQRLSLEVWRDARGDVWRAAGFRALPANWIASARGAQTASGPLSEAQWRARLRELGCAAQSPAS